jgi:hypothetical protein
MGETQDRPFQLSFNSSLKVDFQGSRVTSDGGLVLVRELDERLGLRKVQMPVGVSILSTTAPIIRAFIPTVRSLVVVIDVPPSVPMTFPA